MSIAEAFRPCIADPSSSRAAQILIDRFFESQFSSTMSSTALVQEQQPDIQCEVGDTLKAIAARADSGDALAVGTHPAWRAEKFMSTTECSRSSFAKSDLPAQPREPELHNAASHPRISQHEVVPNAAPVQKNPKKTENNDFEKLCLAYRASLNQKQKFVFDYGRPEVDVSMSQTSLTTTTSATTITASMAHSHDMGLSEVAQIVEIHSEYSGPLLLVEPSASTSEGLLKHGPPAAHSTCAATDKVESSNLVHIEPGSETSQTLSSVHNGHDAHHHISSGKQKDVVDVDIPSTDHQNASAQGRAVISAAEPLTTAPQLYSSRLGEEQTQPQPAQGLSLYSYEPCDLQCFPPYTPQ